MKLRFAMIGGSRCTTREWIAEFFDALTAARSGAPLASQAGSHALPAASTSRTSAARQRDHQRAEKALAELGI
ncbi:hypothetical protein V5E97_09945 [Singulisphaera sp. Ch08]|uniref:Uncharacterized protein n=1 Tax=Singulisphaera sp. Ch08 TaxID=3120278 RepID=A0AAU7CM82_9BACT